MRRSQDSADKTRGNRWKGFQTYSINLFDKETDVNLFDKEKDYICKHVTIIIKLA